MIIKDTVTKKNKRFATKKAYKKPGHNKWKKFN